MVVLFLGAEPFGFSYIFQQTRYNVDLPEFVQKNTRTGEFGRVRRVMLDTDRIYRKPPATLVARLEPPTFTNERHNCISPPPRTVEKRQRRPTAS